MPEISKLIFGVLATVSSSLGCDLYMANSLNENFGRGIFAGKSFKKGSVVEQGPTFIIHNDFAMNCQLEYFVYASDEEDYAVVVLGAGMMYNSLKDESVSHEWESEDIPTIDSVRETPYTTYTDFVYNSEKGIRSGEEIFANYGDKWFRDRGIDPTTPDKINKARYAVETLKEEGHCMTDIYFKESSIPMAGKGVFTRKAYKAGDLVSISPVIVLSRRDIYDYSEESLLVNYCISQNSSDAAILPMGRAAMMNHGGKDSNIKVEWHQWDKSIASRTALPLPDIMALPFSPLDLQYIATRDIAEGEELLLSYGEDWEIAWMKHLESLHDITAQYQDALEDWDPTAGPKPVLVKPQFRHHITAPEGLFPEHFNVPCVGFSCDYEESPIEGDLEKVFETMEAIEKSVSHANAHFLTEGECV